MSYSSLHPSAFILHNYARKQVSIPSDDSGTGGACRSGRLRLATLLAGTATAGPAARGRLEKVIEAVNHNNSQIQALYSGSATLSGPGIPTTLRAHIAYQRQRNFRLRADTGVTGPEVDLGSNDQIFWFWIKPQPAAGAFTSAATISSPPARRGG